MSEEVHKCKNGCKLRFRFLSYKVFPGKNKMCLLSMVPAETVFSQIRSKTISDTEIVTNHCVNYFFNRNTTF